MSTLLIHLALQRLAGSAAKTQALGTDCQCRIRHYGGLQGDLEARFTVALPGRGRTIMGKWAATVLVQNLPRSAQKTMLARWAYVRPVLFPQHPAQGGVVLLAACSLTPELDALCNLMSHYPFRFVEQGLLYSSQHHAALQRHVLCVEDQESLRGQLSGLRLAAFVADGSILPRCVYLISARSQQQCLPDWVGVYILQ